MVTRLALLVVALAAAAGANGCTTGKNHYSTSKLYQSGILEQCLTHCHATYRVGRSHLLQYINTSNSFPTYQHTHCNNNRDYLSTTCSHNKSISQLIEHNTNSLTTFDEEYANFPRLYHLDDYESCLMRTDGLYCLGTFNISPLKESDPTFAMIEEYSRDARLLDRRRVHRGYCLSSRCPALLAERNVTLRFERCVSRWARGRSLRTTLTQLGYCHTHGQHLAHTRTETQLDLPHGVFLLVLTLLLLMNIVGTAYDILTGDDSKKCHLLTMWSVPSNWQRLTTTYEQTDPRLSALSPLQGVRVMLAALILAGHTPYSFMMLYLNNPRWMEQAFDYPMTVLLLNGSPMIQTFTVMSSFLLANRILSKNNAPSFKMLPEIIITRIARFLAVDMQLYILAAVLTLSLAHMKTRALHLLAALVVASSVINGLIAYIFKWQTMVHYINARELSTLLHNVPSFSRYYITPWASLPACLVGLFCAFLHVKLQETGVKMASHKCLKLAYHITPLAIIAWIMSGIYVKQYTERWFVATYVAVEKTVISTLVAFVMMGMFNGLGGWLQRFLSWRGWQTPGRLSLAAIMVHWCVNTTITAGRQLPLTASLFYVMVDWIAVVGLSFALAVPLCIMVEIPVHRFIHYLILRKY